MKRNGFLHFAALIAASLWNVGGTSAQEASLVSYSALAERVAELEHRLASQPLDVADVGMCCETCCESHWYGLYESVIVVPHFTRDAAFFSQTAGPNTFSEVSFDWDLKYSPRFEVGKLNECGLGIRGRYWQFDSSTTANGAAGDFYASFSGGDDQTTVEIDGVIDITATHTLKMDVVDLEATKLACNWLFSAGLRYARIDQSYLAISTGPDIFAQHDFEGLGLTMAIDYRTPICGNLSAFAKGRGSLLYGHSSFFATDLGTGDTLLRDNNQDLVAVAELQLGVDWRTCTSWGSVLFINAAAEAQYWSSGGTALPGRLGSDDGNYVDSNPQDANLGFFGLNLGVGMLY